MALSSGHGGNRATGGNYYSGDSVDKTSRATARVASPNESNKNPDWGNGASRSLYSVFSNLGDDEMTKRDLLKSRLWKGVPQLTEEQMKSFEAAYTGHTFLFVIDVPRFMTQGYYKGTNMHALIRNLKGLIERASTGFSGISPITADFDTQDDGNERKMDHMTRVYKTQGPIQIKIHEFAALPVKNAIEAWLTGVYDPYSEHGNYHGNLGIPGGWCTANHTMSMLVVQTDPSWTEIQDAAYYYNMMPTEVPFDHFEWTKGDHNIIQDYSLEFRCNEFRGPSIMYAAEKFMNARILSMVSTSVFNSRQFNPLPNDIDTRLYNSASMELGNKIGDDDAYTIIDSRPFNTKITNAGADNNSLVGSWNTENQVTPTIEYENSMESDKNNHTANNESATNG